MRSSTVHRPPSTKVVSNDRGPWTVDRGPTSLGWRVFVERGLSAEAQMARDVALARDTLPTVRLFQWDPPAVSLGLKQPAPAWLDAPAWRAAGLDVVERPTGGGLAFHGSDVSIAVVVPRALDLPLPLLMRAACENGVALCRAIGAPADAVLDTPVGGRITYCLTEASPYAVMIWGRKVAGFALRRFPQTWLIQGSLLVQPLPGALAAELPEAVTAQLRTRAIPLSEALAWPVSGSEVVERWADGWAGWWEETLLQVLADEASG